MQSFSRRKKIQETETLIKESLLRQLSYSIEEVHLLVSKKEEVFSTDEASNSLVVILESIFLHGLKKGLLKSALKTVSGGEERKPQPSFWNICCNYSHKDVISTIQNLSQITTDVGKCRVWIRLALNQGEITSYFIAMEKDRRALNSSYSNNAFLRDKETCDIACKFLEGILAVQFEIPINSSILNTWNSEPLMLSGLWSPPMKTPLSNAIDIAERIEDGDEEDDSCSIKTSSSITTLSSILTLDESQALKIILETPIKKLSKDMVPTSQPVIEYNDRISEEEEGEQQEVKEEKVKENEEREEIKNVKSGKGNSLMNAHGWSSTNVTLPPEPEQQKNMDKDKEQKIEEYSSLLEKVGLSPNVKVNYEARFREMMQRNKKQSDDSPTTQSQNSNYNCYTSKLYKIVKEIGLKAQKYTCANCQLSIGLTFEEARLCYFTGEYYCSSCHLNETSVIPSRLIFNWDHKKYPVCSKVYTYLNDICSRFLIDIKSVNPKIYTAVQEMKDLRVIRVQLYILKGYFFTCKESVLLDFQKKLSPREYLYEFIDHYPINDLCLALNGALANELEPIVSFGRNHVINCCLCSQKGFICEICKNPNVIYPFDMYTTYRCCKCYSVYHNTCLSLSKNCPKCKRLKTRTLSQNESSVLDND